MTQQRIPQLDGLRAMAILAVMFCHFFGGTPILGRVAPAGQLGVDLFFVLSGFLITRILIASKDSLTYFRDFYMRRVLRIFPLYYGFLVLHYFILPWLFDFASFVPLSQQIWYWTYLQNLPIEGLTRGPGHFWSLAVEEHFYLVWPWLVYVLPIKRLPCLVLAVVLGAIICRAALLSYGVGVYYFTPCRMDALALGAGLAYIERQQGLKRFKVVFQAGLVTITALLLLLWPLFSGTANNVIQIVRFTFISSFFSCLVGYVCADSYSTLARLTQLPLLRHIGTISYGLYVFHWLAFLLAEEAVTHWLTRALIASVLAYAMAVISFYGFEKRILAFKARFENYQMGS